MSRPTPDLSAQRAALEARKSALRSQIAARQAASPRASAALAAQRRRRRRNLFMALVVVIVLLLLRWCSGEPEELPPPPPEVPAEPEVVEAEPAPVVRSRPNNSGRVAATPRPNFEPPKPSALPWLVAFRMQVAARSRGLAACVQGTAEPGRLRWTTTVDPAEGTVSDHALEPLLEGAEPTSEEAACILAALASPTYRLNPDTAPDTPQRVSLVLEF